MPDPMSDALVLVTQEGAVRTLALNRPAALNSFTGAMHLELRAALEAAAADASVRCVVLTGTGRGFCAGQDLSDPMMNSAPGEPPKDVRLVLDAYYQPLLMQLRAMPVPVLAAVNGVAAGAGANIALACDVVVAKASASFIQAFSKIGLIPDAGGTWSVPRLVGRAKAMGLAMLGDKLGAAEAERLGLIWQCLEDDAYQAGVNALATRLAGMPTRALVATRALIDGAQTQTLAQALESEAAMQSALSQAFDYQEGVAAFQAKRAPVYKDR
jgi:2-(1,2-epoxy-1,2-dihydrophenyl)acetyl-CoA isomerase